MSNRGSVEKSNRGLGSFDSASAPSIRQGSSRPSERRVPTPQNRRPIHESWYDRWGPVIAAGGMVAMAATVIVVKDIRKHEDLQAEMKTNEVRWSLSRSYPYVDNLLVDPDGNAVEFTSVNSDGRLVVCSGVYDEAAAGQYSEVSPEDIVCATPEPSPYIR